LTFNTDYRYTDNAPVSLLNNVGVNLLGSFASGTPYTPAKLWNEVTLGAGAAEPIGPINSRVGPYTFRVDMKANKAISLAGLDLNMYVWVLNLLDRENAIGVYESSGDPQSTTYAQSEEGRAVIEANSEPHDSSGLTAEQKYKLAEQDPELFDTPRIVRFGVELSF
jgi:hypothetical protein